MGKKKNKNNGYVEQDSMEMFNRFMNAINNGEIPGECDDYDSFEGDSLESIINERLNRSSNSIDLDNDDDEDTVDTTDNISDSISYSDLKKESTQTKTESSNGIQMKLSNGEFKIFTITDGIKTVSIDINTLRPRDISSNIDIDKALLCGAIRLTEIMTNFYPTAIISKSRFYKLCKSVKEYDDSKYKFFEHPDCSSNLIIGYHIDDDSMSVFYDLIYSLYDSKQLPEFLEALDLNTMQPGFSFRDIDLSYAKTLMLLDKYKRYTNTFMELFLDDDETVIDHDNNEEFEGLYPFIFDSGYVDSVLNEILCDDEDDEEDECDCEHHNHTDVDIPDDDGEAEDVDETEEPEITDTITFSVKETITETTQVISPNVTFQQAQPDDDVIEESDEDSLLDDTIDYEDAAKEYLKNNKQEPRTTMKKYNKSDDSDDMFVVKRQS